MFTRPISAMGLLAMAAILGNAPSHAEEAAKTEPKTGKNCVTFISSEWTNTGMLRMNFRNICASPFQIRIPVGESTREKAIEPGSPEKPSKAYINCKSDDRCEVAKWGYQ
jgi:hypothetical protein